MRSHHFHMLGLAGLAVMAAAQPLAAQTEGSKPAPLKVQPESESSRTVDALLLGYQLADYARATKDARAMIVAARIVDSIPVKESADPGKLSGPASSGGSAKPLTGAQLFAEARMLAAGDPELVAAIEQAQAEASRGCACGGAIRTVQYIPGNTIWTLRLSWRGGEPMVVGVRRDSAVPVGLKIFDENGNLVCQDMSGNVTMYCRVNPIWTGAFAIQTINYGTSGTGVALVTN